MPAKRRKKAKAAVKAPKVQWVGDPEAVAGGALEYPGARFGDESFAPGDFVYLQNPDGDERPVQYQIPPPNPP